MPCFTQNRGNGEDCYVVPELTGKRKRPLGSGKQPPGHAGEAENQQIDSVLACHKLRTSHLLVYLIATHIEE